MDDFNPFQNAWSDGDNAIDNHNNGALNAIASTNTRKDSLPTWDTTNSINTTPPATTATETAASYPSWEADREASTSGSWEPPTYHDQDNDHVAGGQGTFTPRAASPFESDAEEQQDDDTGFDGFGAAGRLDLGLAASSNDAGAVNETAAPIDDPDSWGETALPPSKWEESLNARPTWNRNGSVASGQEGWGGTGSTRPDELDLGREEEGRRDDEEEAQEEPQTTHSRQACSSQARPSTSGAQADADELAEIKRLQEEYGITVRNLDEEYSSPAPPSSSNAPVSAGAASKGRWSLFSRKEAPIAGSMSSITTSNEPEAATLSVAAREEAAALAALAQSQLARAGKEAKKAAANAQTMAGQAQTAATAAAAAGQAQVQAAAAGSRWFRFGRNRNVSEESQQQQQQQQQQGASASTSGAAGAESKSAAAAEAAPATPVMDDDFGQLENFSSTAARQANGYDDFGSSSKEDGLDLSNKGGRWGALWSLGGGPLSPAGAAGKHAALGRDGAMRSSTGIDDDDDGFAGLDAAFSQPAPGPYGVQDLLTGPPQRKPSVRNSANATAASMAASLAASGGGMRSSSSMDAFDPLDPLAEMRQASNRVRSASKGAFGVAAGAGEHPLRRSGSTSSAKNVSPFPMRAPLHSAAATAVERPRTTSPTPQQLRDGQPPRIPIPQMHIPLPGSTRQSGRSSPASNSSGLGLAKSPKLFDLSATEGGGGAGVKVRMAAEQRPTSSRSSGGAAPPLLAPPPGFSGAGARRTPSPANRNTSLIDDLADLDLLAPASKPAGVTGSPSSLQALASSSGAREGTANSIPAPAAGAAASAEDDFGDFTDFVTSPTLPASASAAASALPAKAKASGPMKLAPPPGGVPAIPRELEKELGPRPGNNPDLDFFDSLL